MLRHRKNVLMCASITTASVMISEFMNRDNFMIPMMCMRSDSESSVIDGPASTTITFNEPSFVLPSVTVSSSGNGFVNTLKQWMV